MTSEPTEDEDPGRPLQELRRIAGGACRDCGEPYTAREAVWNIALGFKDAPRCLRCLSRRLARDPGELRGQLTGYVARRDCYLRAWREAARLDGVEVPEVPGTHPEAELPVRPPDSQPARPDAEWDAGDMGCGELVMQLRIRLNNLPPRSVIKVRATDPAAPEDIPAWCRLCGHELVAASHPEYRIRRREV